MGFIVRLSRRDESKKDSKGELPILTSCQSYEVTSVDHVVL